jgi:putative ABC transport system permease protein
MLKYLPLLWANLRRKPVRTGLTIASIAVAFLLFGVLEAFRSALSAGVDFAGQDRLVTINKVTLIQPMPGSYLARVRSVPGVTVATTQNWFGGIYQEDRNTVTAFAVTVDTFFQTFPEMKLDEAQKRAFLSERTAAIVGKTLAAQYGWKIGQTIPLRSNVWVRKDGGNTWDMKIVGIYDISQGDTNTLYFNYDYLNETRDELTRDSIGMVAFRIDNTERAAEIARNVDALFANSSTETKTTTERAFTQAFVNQIGDVGSIVVAVAFAVFFTNRCESGPMSSR